jgi:hypothetical protein
MSASLSPSGIIDVIDDRCRKLPRRTVSTQVLGSYFSIFQHLPDGVVDLKSIFIQINMPEHMMLCAANMLRHVNLDEYGLQIYNAVRKVLEDGKVRTKDLGGHSTTRQFTAAVINNINNPGRA